MTDSSERGSLDPMWRQVYAGAGLLFAALAAFALFQLLAAQGLGWSAVGLAYVCVAMYLAARLLAEPALYGLSLWLGLGAAALNAAGVTGLIVFSGGIGSPWVHGAFGVFVVGASVYRLATSWRHN